MSAVQRLGTFTVIHLGRFEGMPEEMDGVRLVFATNTGQGSNERSRLFVADADNYALAREAPEPSQFIEGVLAAAKEIDEEK